MMGFATSDVSEIEDAIATHGVTPGGSVMMLTEAAAANESIASGLYVSWMPHPSCILTSLATDEIRNGTGQCCRVGSQSICLCGHSLQSHKEVKVPKSSGYIKPPTCSSCRKCTGFNYAPSRPEECGQWWLPRRSDFNIAEWRQRLREKPHEYACLGCEQTVANHETVFESRAGRLQRGAAVGSAFIPLSDNPKLTAQVINGEAKIGGRVRRALPGASSSSSSSAVVNRRYSPLSEQQDYK